MSIKLRNNNYLSFARLFMAVFLLTLFVHLNQPKHAAALALPTKDQYLAPTDIHFNAFNFIQATFSGGTKILFIDNEPYDGNWTYSAVYYERGGESKAWPASCRGLLQVESRKNHEGFGIGGFAAKPTWGDAKLAIDTGDPDSGVDCTKHLPDDKYEVDFKAGGKAVSGQNISVQDTGSPYAKTRTQYRYTNESTIVGLSDKVGSFSYTPDKNYPTSVPGKVFFKNNAATECKERLVVNATDKNIGFRYELIKDRDRGTFSFSWDYRADETNTGTTCGIVSINGMEGYANKDFDPSTNQHWQAYICPLDDDSCQKSADLFNAISGGTGGIENIGADCGWSINPLTWIFCPLLSGLQSLIQDLDTVIEQNLKINTEWFNADPETAEGTTGIYLHAAWNYIYDISVGLLVLIGIVMVLSQALQFGPFDAYTIRRVMPRIIIAVVFMTLSWTLLGLLIGIFNILGEGIRAIIYTPFQKLDPPKVNGATITALFTAGGAGAAAGIMGLLAFVGAVALALLVGMATIIFRQLLVVALVLFAPFAILCFILPGTRKVWQMWYNNLIRALVVFPIVMAFIALGWVFAKILSASSGQSTISFNNIAALFVLYAPYFMLPMAFSLAGGAVGALKGVASIKAAPGMAKLKETRSQSGKATRSNILNNKAFAGGTASTRDANGNIVTRGDRRGRANERLARITNVGAAGLSLNREDRRAKINTRMTSINQQNAAGLAETAEFRAITNDSRLLLAGSHRDENGQKGTVASITQYLEGEGQTGVELTNNVAAVRAATRVKGQSAYDSLAVVKAVGAGGFADGGQGEMNQAIDNAAGGDRALASQLLGQARSEAQRANRPDLYGNTFTEAQTLMNNQYANGSRDDDIAHTNRVSRGQVREQLGMATIMAGKSGQAAQILNQTQEDFNDAILAGNLLQAEHYSAHLVAARSSVNPNTPNATKQALNAALQASGYDSGQQSTVLQQHAARIQREIVPQPALTYYAAGATMHRERKLPSGYMTNIASGGELTEEGEAVRDAIRAGTTASENRIRAIAGGYEQQLTTAQLEAERQQNNGSGTT